MTVTEKEARTLAYGAAFNEGLRQIMEEDPDVFFAGEDVGKACLLYTSPSPRDRG